MAVLASMETAEHSSNRMVLIRPEQAQQQMYGAAAEVAQRFLAVAALAAAVQDNIENS
jgi:hypothetical protein